ncbi:hypothetical protein EIP91_011079 [Steccherinum ochraceum]|uniref:Uncharacterized protein n=1 Tax=Steccherinum ochraceum TaxID=92696 RepID=A0A4R0S1T9_9APHY|nr:hypothetical protein EIP91_011079 [Steccherinum ochraceum]
MTALPSFVELMASLGLENSSSDGQDSHPQHSRSSSYSSTASVVSRSSAGNLPTTAQLGGQGGSPSIVISRHPSSSSLNRDSDSERRKSRTRYAPYSPSISHMRRGSVPSLSAGEDELHTRPTRALSSSPVPNLATRTVGRRSSGLGLHGRRPENLTLGEPDFIASTPISTYVRRKTPTSSPISPTFPHRKRSSSPSAPVLIPTLPTFIFPQLPTINGGSGQSSDSEDDPMGAPVSSVIRRRRNHQKLSVKQLRASRRSDSNITLARSTTLEPPPIEAQRLTPVA